MAGRWTPASVKCHKVPKVYKAVWWRAEMTIGKSAGSTGTRNSLMQSHLSESKEMETENVNIETISTKPIPTRAGAGTKPPLWGSGAKRSPSQ